MSTRITHVGTMQWSCLSTRIVLSVAHVWPLGMTAGIFSPHSVSQRQPHDRSSTDPTTQYLNSDEFRILTFLSALVDAAISKKRKRKREWLCFEPSRQIITSEVEMQSELDNAVGKRSLTDRTEAGT